MSHLFAFASLSSAVVLMFPVSGVPAPCVQETDELRPDHTGSSDQFGNAMAVEGDALIVGGMFFEGPGDDNGAAFVFRLEGTAWVEEQELVADDAVNLEHFGNAVDIDADVVIVGAVDDETVAGAGAGSAYVFRFDGLAWVQEQKLEATDAFLDQEFGKSVAVSGDQGLVGAWYDDNNGFRAGAAYVFGFDGSTWCEEQKLLAPDGDNEDWFGSSVGLSGNRALVGAMLEDTLGDNAGAVYAFEHGDHWIPTQKLLPSDGIPGAGFGLALAVDGDVAVVGASFDSEGGVTAGAAYVFRHDGEGWVEQQKLVASDATGGEEFGFAVAISGETIVIGAMVDDDFGFSSGSAYLFRFDGTEWVEQQKILPTDGGEGELFGWAVGVAPGHVFSTAWNDLDETSAKGSLYVFELLAPDIVEQPISQSINEGLDATFTVAASGSGELYYQWFKDDEVLVDDGHILGAQTGELTITGVVPGDAGLYHATVEDECDVSVSDTATLEVLSVCEGDANGDGAVDPLDSGYVLARFGCPVGTGDANCDAADQNGDGAVDPLDSGFVLARFGQCP